jgi:hypothetical protein
LITGKQIKDGSVTSADIKNGSLLAADFKAGELKTGPIGLTGPAGAPGSPGAAGAAGAPGTALAFAHIKPDGTVDAANSKSVAATNVTRPAAGTYCISGLTPAPKNVVANVGANGTAFTVVTGSGAVLGCGPGTQFALAAFDVGGLDADNDLWVAIN